MVRITNAEMGKVSNPQDINTTHYNSHGDTKDVRF